MKYRDKDVTIKDYLKDPCRVADLVNVTVFGGRPLVTPDNIHDADADLAIRIAGSPTAIRASRTKEKISRGTEKTSSPGNATHITGSASKSEGTFHSARNNSDSGRAAHIAGNTSKPEGTFHSTKNNSGSGRAAHIAGNASKSGGTFHSARNTSDSGSAAQAEASYVTGSSSRTADTAKDICIGNKHFLLYLEHQDYIDYAMPKRNAVLEAASYQEQHRKICRRHHIQKDLPDSSEYLAGFAKEDRLMPAIVITLYYGEDVWDGVCDLRDLLDIPEGDIRASIEDLILQYRMKLIDVRRFEDTEKFQTDLRETFSFIKYSSNKEELYRYIQEHQDRFQNLPGDAYDFLAARTNSRKLFKLKKRIQTKKGGFDVCKAIDDMIKDGETRGEARGRIEGEKLGEARGEARGRIEGEKRGEARGEKRGIQKGRRYGAMDMTRTVARNLFLKGCSVEEAASICEVKLAKMQKLYKRWA